VDPYDRDPAEVRDLMATRRGAVTVRLDWSAASGADAYSVTRGVLSQIGASQYGGCLAEGLAETSHEDGELPPPGDGFAYLVQAQNFDCGLGPLGYTSAEQPRENLSAGACAGHPHTDAHAETEESVYGTVLGSYLDTLASDDVWERITEELSGGNPSLRYSRLEHRWTVTVPPGVRIELHVEAFRTASPDSDDFAFEYSTDGGQTWDPASVPTLPELDDGIDRIGTLPASVTGTVLIRVIDTDRSAGHQDLDRVSVDVLFVRSVP
jgi:hypothetical protein